MIDYYLEEEKELRRKADKLKWNIKVLDQKIDVLWGKVTLYNCYQLFVQLSSKKKINPTTQLKKDLENGVYENLSNSEHNKLVSDAEYQSDKFWEGRPEIDLLTLYFNITKCLPRNGIRSLVDNADSSLRAMGGAEKMLSSVYGIAITAMVRVVAM